mmetsp:Transcript_21057/g.27329  ORF Transcript_21057/g.27329 Transcript_21057/m.27329 type:complete len:170 (-) Transcript_21057:114-623(-)
MMKKLDQLFEKIAPKKDYLEVCKENYYEPETHIVRRAAVISGRESTVTLYRARRDGCRCRVYDQRTCDDFEIVLSKFRLQELNIPHAPTEDEGWEAWSRLLIERLQFSQEGVLFVGAPPLQANGLPKKFALVDEDTLAEHLDMKEKGTLKEDSVPNAGRLNIRMFFDLA